MKKDTKTTLEQLEAELLETDDPELDALLEEFGPEAPAPVTGVKIRNTDITDTDLETYSNLVYDEPTKPGHGLNLLALISIAVSAAALVYMVLRLQ